jgi:hypothetical protein
MLPSSETCARWSERKFVRQPHRMVIAIFLCLAVTVYALFSGQPGPAKLFGGIGAFFVALYAAANYIVWKAEQVAPEE